MQSSKVVLDTNIWISYFLRNNNEQFLRSILDNDIKLYRCTALTQELTDVIMRPKVLRKLQLPAKEYITFYEVLTHNFPTTPVFTACSDPADNFLFDLAVQTNANYLVSGDKKVLTTSATPNLSVITLAQFEKLLLNP